MTLVHQTYRLVMRALSLALPWWIRRRARSGKEDPNRLHERFARNLPPRPDSLLVWMHGASVGESLILLSLADQIQATRKDLHILFTSQTLTSARIVGQSLSPNRRHQMAPLDTPAAAKRFMAHWQPDLAVFAEGDIWPNLLVEADTSGCALALINARMTNGSLKGWGRVKATAKDIFSRFDLIIAANQLTADGLSGLSGKDVVAPGNLKSALPPPPSDPEEEAALRQGFLNGRPCLLAASTHPGEEDLFLKALLGLSLDVCAVIAPRHPERGDEIRARLADGGWTFAQRSRGEAPSSNTRIYLADTLGEMGLWFALADGVYLGGAHTAGVGGHNPIEPLSFGKPIISGHEHFNFTEMFAELKAAGAMSLADTETELVSAFSEALADPDAHTLSESDRLAFLAKSNAAMRITTSGLLALLDTAVKR